jgi:hypothetical protein
MVQYTLSAVPLVSAVFGAPKTVYYSLDVLDALTQAVVQCAQRVDDDDRVLWNDIQSDAEDGSNNLSKFCEAASDHAAEDWTRDLLRSKLSEDQRLVWLGFMQKKGAVAVSADLSVVKIAETLTEVDVHVLRLNTTSEKLHTHTYFLALHARLKTVVLMSCACMQ